MSIKSRLATNDDLACLLKIEAESFDTDRLTKRRFKHWISAENSFCLVAVINNQVVGYGLVIFRQTSRSARLYSLAIEKAHRGQNIAQLLLSDLELLAVNRQKLFMRLEVAENNTSAINIYLALGYKQFGMYKQYYANGLNALRFQKAIKQSIANKQLPNYPWFQQSTEFTCGPAALMMASKKLQSNFVMSPQQEIDIWRQATTVFMTSGHGGCHPIGLAIAASKLGFNAQVYINQSRDLFLEGVRSEHKKSVMQLVESQFFDRAKERQIAIHHADYDLIAIELALKNNCAVICLISTYQFDGKKAPHWVVITHIDDTCLYFHDPDASINGMHQNIQKLIPKEKQRFPLFEENKFNIQPNKTNLSDRKNELALAEEQDFQASSLDYQHVPILKEDFTKLSMFGKSKLRTCVIIQNNNQNLILRESV